MRVCTCHPDDKPPQPCVQKYALKECRRVADKTSAEPVKKPRSYNGWLRLPNGVEMLGNWVREDELPAPDVSGET